MSPKPTYEELEQRNNALTEIVTQNDIDKKLLRIQLDLLNALYESDNFEKSLSMCLDAAIEASDMDCGGIYLFDDATQDLRLMFQKGLPSSFIESVSSYKPNSEHIELIRKGEPIYSNHQEFDVPLTDDKKNERLRAIAIIPISDKNKVAGCMNVASHTIDDVPNVSRFSLEAIASQIGSAIRRMKIEQALFKEEQRFAAFFESIPIGTVMSNSPSEPFTVNTAFADLLDYSKEALQTMSAVETGKMITHPVDFKEELQSYLNYNSGETNRHRIEKRFIKKNGDLITADVSTSFIVSDDGNFILGMSAVQDITDRKQTEEALIESEERFRKFIENAPIGMYTVNTKGEFTYGNKKLLEITGYEEKDWLNRPFHSLVYPDDLPIVMDKIERRRERLGTTQPYEIRIYKASGEIIWVKITSESIYDKRHQLIGILNRQLNTLQ